MRVPRMSALGVIVAVGDAGSFRSWDVGVHRNSGIPDEYRLDLDRASGATGADESVRTGSVAIHGIPVAVLSWEFQFLGGSIGIDAAVRLVAAIRRATAQGLPVVALPRSGGTRMQEGAPAFAQMVAITAALSRHRRAGLPYLVHLCDPTSGGVLATLGSLGDVTTAEPHAMVGFLGPRAVRALTGRELPAGVQTAENLQGHGIVDAVLDLGELRQRWALLLGAWRDRGTAPSGVGPPDAAPPAPSTSAELWARIAESRAMQRPGAPDLMDRHLTGVVALPGTGSGELAHGVRVGVARLAAAPLVVVATTDRRTGQPLTVAGLRTIRRGIALASRWGLPVLALIDTLGVQLSADAEESGVAGEIARTMLDLLEVPTPTVAVLLGPGTGGAALALLAADRVVATGLSWVCPVAPEGAAAIRVGGIQDPAVIAWEQRVGVHALAELGLVDRIVDDSGPEGLARVASAAAGALAEALVEARHDRRVERYGAWSR